MAKILIKDMVEHKRAVRKLVVKENRKTEEVETFRSQGGSRHMLWLVALISALFLFFALSFLFAKAEVTVNPKMTEIVLDENFSADKNSDKNELPFDMVIVSGEESKIIKANTEKNISEKAIGTVIIYNAYSSASQTLDIDTRLEGSNGKIYKTQRKTIVPGKSKSGVPGSVEVKIYGAEAGEEYNSAPLDFNIFGFKGTPKYSKFYARSKGEISGGFKGAVPAVSSEEETKAVSDLKEALQAKLLKKATEQIPAEFILFKNAIFFDTGVVNIPLVTENGNLNITLKGSLYGILLNEQKLTQKIVKNKIEGYDGSDVYLSSIRDLNFTLSQESSALSSDKVAFSNAKNIDFNLSGSTKVVSKLNLDKFINDLAGKPKKDFSQVLIQYGNIDSAVLKLSPMWRSAIPDKIENINIIVNYPQ